MNPFEKGNIITNKDEVLVNGELVKSTRSRIIGVFSEIGWHGGDKKIFNSSFADFNESIVVEPNGNIYYNTKPNGDDDTYCRGDNLGQKYRLATSEEQNRYKDKMNKHKSNKSD